MFEQTVFLTEEFVGLPKDDFEKRIQFVQDVLHPNMKAWLDNWRNLEGVFGTLTVEMIDYMRVSHFIGWNSATKQKSSLAWKIPQEIEVLQ